MANLESFPQDIIGAESSLGMIPAPSAVNEVTPLAAAPQLTGVASGVGGGAGLGNTTVALGRAGSIGSISVPANWAAPSGSPVTTLSSSGLPAFTASEVPAGSGSGLPGLLGMRSASRATLVVPRYGVRPTVMPRPPYAG